MVGTTRALLVRLGQAYMALRIQRELFLAGAGGLVVLAGLFCAGIICIRRPGPPAAVAEVESDQAWRYVVACARCGYRSRTTTHPARSLQKQNGLLQCPACEEFAASWFRRGSQTVPPGGWSAADTDAPDNVSKNTGSP